MIAILLSAVLSIADPPGDAVGNGSLIMPTSLVYRTPGVFDALAIDVLETPNFSFSVTMAELNNPWALPNGFSLPIIEIYLATGEEGQEKLLFGAQGAGMALPEGAAWSYAFRLTGDGFRVYRAGEDEPLDVTEAIGARLEVEGNALKVATLLKRPKRFSLYGMVGAYDPFTESGWRPVTPQPSPGTLSSQSQRVRVVDVLADSWEQQQRAINSGVLPEIRASAGSSGWLALAGLGLLLSLLGVGWRLRIGPPAPAQPQPRYTTVMGAAPTRSLKALPAPSDATSDDLEKFQVESFLDGDWLIWSEEDESSSREEKMKHS